jgi:prophage antirepressor-like protein
MKKVKVVGNVPSNTNCNLYVFKSQFFKDKELRVVKNEGECYWFVETDIAKILDYRQIDKISKTIVEEKNKTYYQDTEFYSSASSLKLLPNSILINEDGIKNIIAKTKSKQASAFKEWINNQVLPKLREEEENEEVEEEEEEEEEEDKNPLIINTIEITTRKKDSYINLTSLCKAGNKEYSKWNKNKKTEAFLQALSLYLHIRRDNLIKYETGANKNRATWGHPQVAINIAQWISPEFDVQVSKWIFEIKEDNEKLIKELSIQRMQHNLINDTTFKLKLLNNDVLDIAIRKDGYVNATQLCKAGNKLFADYQKTKQTQDYLQSLSFNMNIPILKLLDSKVGGSHSGTYVHRKVAYHLSQWISPQFAVQVSNVLDELLITGKVELGKEKSNEELENIYKEKLSHVENQLENTKVELKAITNTHNNMLKRQKRTAYEIGNVIYIVSNKAFTMYCNDECYKFGKATQTRDETTSTFTNRLSSYNTCSPINFDVEFLIYVEDNTLVENNIKARFRKDINPTNKEWLKGIKLSVITEYIISLCELTNIEYNVVIDNSKNITPEDIQLEVQEPIVPIQVLSTTPLQIQEPIAPTPVQIQPQQQIAPIQNELFDKYKKILNEIDGYLRPKLIEIARELNLTLTGLKNVLCSRIKVALENKIKELQKKYQCKVCKKFNVSEKRADKCVECGSGRVASRKVSRPSYEQLLKDTRVMSMVKVGQKYGVSDNAIRKWIKGYRN